LLGPWGLAVHHALGTVAMPHQVLTLPHQSLLSWGW